MLLDRNRVGGAILTWLSKAPLEYYRVGNYVPTKNEFVPSSLYTIRAGIQYSRPTYQTGPKVMMWYSLVVVLKGKGWLRTQSGEWRLQVGDAFCIFPECTVSYGTDPQDLFVSAWLGFLGSEAETVLRSVGFSRLHPVMNLYPCYVGAYNLMSQIREDMIAKQPGYMLRSAGLLWQVFGCMSCIGDTSSTNEVQPLDDMQNVASYIDMNYPDIRSITDLAESMGYSRSYLIRRFKEFVGVTPHDYLSQRRIAAAKHLLRESQMIIKTIAYSVGYRSNYYFSRDFTARVGLSPTAYRRQHRGIVETP